MLRNTNSSMNRGVMYCLGLGIMIMILFALNLLLGSVSIPANDVMAILLGLSLSAACCCRLLFVTLWRDRVCLESIVVQDWVWHW